ERNRDRGRDQAPSVNATRCEHAAQAPRHSEPESDAPVVADDEVPPKEGERADVLPAAASTGASASLRRSARTSRNDNAPRNAITPSSESSSPGQVTPAPSAPQKQPKLVSSRPTAYLIVFSGTRSSGPRARTPAPTTTTTAAAAPAAARLTRCWALPKEITMKTTSRPSSRTPLKA